MSSKQQNDMNQQQQINNPSMPPINVSLNPIAGLRQQQQQPQTNQLNQSIGGVSGGGATTTFILNPSHSNVAAAAALHQQQQQQSNTIMVHGGNFNVGHPQQHQQQPSGQLPINPTMIGAQILNAQHQQQTQFQSNQPMVMVKTELLSNQSQMNTFNNQNIRTVVATSNANIPNSIGPNTFAAKVSTNNDPGQSQKNDTEMTMNDNTVKKMNDLNNDQTESKSSSQSNQSQPPPPPPPVVALDKQRLKELVEQVDPNEQLEEEVEDVLLSLADDFIESLISQACMLAKHRKSNHLDVKDVQLALDLNWNMWIPGFGADNFVGVYGGSSNNASSNNTSSNIGTTVQQQQQSGPNISSLNNNNVGGGGGNAAMNRGPKKCMITEAHKQRLALIKKVMKKF